MSKHLFFMLSLGLGAALIFTPQAQSAPAQCAKHSVIIQQLQARYGETRQAIGLSGPRRIMEMFSSLSTGTWTIVVTRTNGISCLLATGKNWERVIEKPLPIGDDTVASR